MNTNTLRGGGEEERGERREQREERGEGKRERGEREREISAVVLTSSFLSLM